MTNSVMCLHWGGNELLSWDASNCSLATGVVRITFTEATVAVVSGIPRSLTTPVWGGGGGSTVVQQFRVIQRLFSSPAKAFTSVGLVRNADVLQTLIRMPGLCY